jgi:hypothetical protein
LLLYVSRASLGSLEISIMILMILTLSKPLPLFHKMHYNESSLSLLSKFVIIMFKGAIDVAVGCIFYKRFVGMD